MPKQKRDTKPRILDAANKLFYLQGIHATSVDAIAEKAGVTKRTLYYHFQSKDDLITAYLESRNEPNLNAFSRYFNQEKGSLPDKVESIFKCVSDVLTHPKWRGCGFQRTAGELANKPGHPAIRAASEHKKNVESWLAGELAKHNLNEPDSTARRIVLLLEGAFSSMLIHHDVAYIHEAGRAAADLVAERMQA